MSIAERIPTMSDEDIKTLLANATRLRDGSDAKRAEQAAAILPALEAAAAERRTAKLVLTREKAQARRASAPPRKAKSVAA